MASGIVGELLLQLGHDSFDVQCFTMAFLPRF